MWNRVVYIVFSPFRLSLDHYLTITLRTLDFYEMIFDEGEVLVESEISNMKYLTKSYFLAIFQKKSLGT